LFGWELRDKTAREADRATVMAAIKPEGSACLLDLEEAIHISSRSEDPLVPSPGGEQYYPAQLFWEYDILPSPHYLKGRSCAFIEFWKLPVDVATASAKIEEMSFPVPDDWRLYIDCKRGPSTNQTFPMISVGVPWCLDRSTNEVVRETAARVDEVFKGIGATLRNEWADACCATSEFWETEVRFPAGAYIQTEKGFVRSDWWPESVEEGDD
jgi:hypothetical protein